MKNLLILIFIFSVNLSAQHYRLIIKNEPNNYQYNKFYGSNYNLSNDSLYFKNEWNQEMKIPLSKVESLGYKNGNYAVTGLLIGAGAGLCNFYYWSELQEFNPQNSAFVIFPIYFFISFWSIPSAIIGSLIKDYKEIDIFQNREKITYLLYPNFNPFNNSINLNLNLRF